MASARYTSGSIRVRDIPPLREWDARWEADPMYDPARIDFARRNWHAQDDLLRSRDRQVEENVRMLAGQQWIVWSELRQRYVDVARYLNDDERRWRQLPVNDRLLLWFMLMLARMTENPPVIAFQPGPDRIDSELAEVMDPLHKYLWNDVGMLEVLHRMFSWLIPGGSAFLKTRIDPNAGDEIRYEEPGMLRLLDAEGNPIAGPDGQPIERYADAVPYDAQGQPQARLEPDPETGDYMVVPFGEAHAGPEGKLVVDVLSCLEARGEWGPAPWHQKRWHMHRSFLTPEQAWEAFGVEIEPDVRGDQAEEVGSLFRLLFGSGLFGAAENRSGGLAIAEQASEYVTVYEGFWRPSRFPGMEKRQGQAGGRHMIVAGADTVIRDGARMVPYPHTSPIHEFRFVSLPGRPSGTTPQERMNGQMRTRNRLDAQILEHATKVANPIQLLDTGAGLQEGAVKNLPAQQVYLNFREMAGDPIRYVSPPNLGADVYKAREMLTLDFDDNGNIRGTEGAPPTADASGELAKELRFNADRFIGPTLRMATLTCGRIVEDWILLLPLVWDQQKVLSVAGDDNISRTIVLYPELFREGKINVQPDIESMLPEGRGERQQKVRQLYGDGAFGQPGSPVAVSAYLDLLRFPHLGRAVRPGGIHRATAEQNVGRLLQGAGALEIPIFEWYDHGMHLFVLERFMAAPEYLKVPEPVQAQMVVYRQLLIEAGFMAAQSRMMREAAGLVVENTAALAAQAAIAASPAAAAAGTGMGPGVPDRGPTSEIPSRTRGAA